VNALTDVEAVEGDSFSYIIPSDTFRDIDQGDSLTYTASLANGDSLPNWLVFDPITLTLSSELPMDAAGNYDITIQATDQSGASVSSSFNFSVTNLVQSPTWRNMYNGTSFNDLIIGSDKSEWLFGYSGNDQLVAKGGSDRLYGGTGNDILDGGDGRDLLWGGKGDDLLIGDDGNELLQSVIHNRGDYDLSYGPGSSSGWGNPDQFSSSSDDRLFGGEGDDRLQGGIGRDKLYGGDGDDVLHGGAGNDTLIGGSGNDTYLFSINDGRDTIHNRDSDPESSDTLYFDGISYKDLMFSRHRSDLIIDVVGTDDKVTVKNWYRGDDYQLDTIETSDLVFQNDLVNQLVSVMAQFDAPSGVGSVHPQDVKDLFTPVIASS
jgi:Ca2+-binding RTX toxin-like protein